MEQLIDESKTVYNYRLQFIKKFKNKNNDFKEKDYIRLSKIAANIKFKECRYDSIIYNKIKNYI